ncbi:uncharacterized protein LOC117620126 isoform X3 [Prunus dulcis]|uniref:uncharacterized protein LOC117620126 isoform X3 n=1 Tax=Prunus dulcis TaxID=3755 RepID=UPI001482585F|nr:uncharacterized protein LOC117620126 isoform X3 [Prunus dulcis]
MRVVGWMAGVVLRLVIKEFEVGFDLNNKSTMSSWPTSPFMTGLSFQGGFKFWESRRFHVRCYWIFKSLLIWIPKVEKILTIII